MSQSYIKLYIAEIGAKINGSPISIRIKHVTLLCKNLVLV